MMFELNADDLIDDPDDTHCIVRELREVSCYLDSLSRSGEDIEDFGSVCVEELRRLRMHTAIALAALSDSMRSEGWPMWETAVRIGMLALSGMRSPEQLAIDACWFRGLAIVRECCGVLDEGRVAA